MAEITRLDQVTEFPLCWPPAKPRAATRQPTPFKTPMAKVQRDLVEELQRWRANRWVVSMAPSFRQGPVDPGVALWWTMPIRANQAITDLRVLACDNYQRREANLHAIRLTLTGLRAFERYGTYTREQAIEGARAALPPPFGSEGPPWWEALGVARDWPLGAIEVVWKSKIEKAHPDRGGAPGDAARLNAAMDAARKEKGDG